MLISSNFYLKADKVHFTIAYVEAFVFVAEFEIRQLGTNADVKYKSSLFIQLLNIESRAGAEVDSSTQLKRRYQSADITQMHC